MKFNSAYDVPKTSGLDCSVLPSRAKQSMRDECDINRIMAKYERTGLASWVNENEARYGDFEALDYHEAMNFIADANSMFQALPADMRSKFGNDPGRFLEFVENPANAVQMREMGLLSPEADGEGSTPSPVAPASGDPSTPV